MRLLKHEIWRSRDGSERSVARYSVSRTVCPLHDVIYESMLNRWTSNTMRHQLRTAGVSTRLRNLDIPQYEYRLLQVERPWNLMPGVKVRCPHIHVAALNGFSYYNGGNNVLPFHISTVFCFLLEIKVATGRYLIVAKTWGGPRRRAFFW
jgi:hypothetical protein